MALGSATHKRSSCAHAPIISVKSLNTRHWLVLGKILDVPQMDRSNERYSRNPRGTSYPLLQPLRPGYTTGVLKGFRVQCRQPIEGGGLGYPPGAYQRSKMDSPALGRPRLPKASYTFEGWHIQGFPHKSRVLRADTAWVVCRLNVYCGAKQGVPRFL